MLPELNPIRDKEVRRATSNAAGKKQLNTFLILFGVAVIGAAIGNGLLAMKCKFPFRSI